MPIQYYTKNNINPDKIYRTRNGKEYTGLLLLDAIEHDPNLRLRYDPSILNEQNLSNTEDNLIPTELNQVVVTGKYNYNKKPAEEPVVNSEEIPLWAKKYLLPVGDFVKPVADFINDEILLNKDGSRVKNYLRAMERNPNFSRDWDMLHNIREYFDAVTGGAAEYIPGLNLIGVADDVGNVLTNGEPISASTALRAASLFLPKAFRGAARLYGDTYNGTSNTYSGAGNNFTGNTQLVTYGESSPFVYNNGTISLNPSGWFTSTPNTGLLTGTSDVGTLGSLTGPITTANHPDLSDRLYANEDDEPIYDEDLNNLQNSEGSGEENQNSDDGNRNRQDPEQKPEFKDGEAYYDPNDSSWYVMKGGKPHRAKLVGRGRFKNRSNKLELGEGLTLEDGTKYTVDNTGRLRELPKPELTTNLPRRPFRNKAGQITPGGIVRTVLPWAALIGGSLTLGYAGYKGKQGEGAITGTAEDYGDYLFGEEPDTTQNNTQKPDSTLNNLSSSLPTNELDSLLYQEYSDTTNLYMILLELNLMQLQK